MDWLNSIMERLGVASPNAQTAENQPKQTEEQKQDTPSALTTDELIEQMVKTMTQNQSEITIAPPNATAEPKPEQPTSKQEVEEEEGLDENATIQDLVKYINRQIEKQFQKLREEQPTPRVPNMHRLMVEDVVSSHPELASVKDDAVRILGSAPTELLNPKSVELFMYMLKGMNAEKEKSDAVAELLRMATTDTVHTSATPVALPYSSSQLREFADQLGLSPERLRSALAEHFVKRGGR